ncbi:hypothetical protein RchiOBHm_Chr6g0288971 [Rosa chinensis]|uniref:Uncharacterized protein n=1 Tax=Rosa chinensis TaxID=74649 RepID=A0A2P6PVG9_ROSCH|nr:hypothetical protein RchiOBHm_Chr6g0288971 [Rosa chinensis]
MSMEATGCKDLIEVMLIIHEAYVVCRQRIKRMKYLIGQGMADHNIGL